MTVEHIIFLCECRVYYDTERITSLIGQVPPLYRVSLFIASLRAAAVAGYTGECQLSVPSSGIGENGHLYL